MWYFLACGLCRWAFRILGGLESVGAENIPETGAVILASNHISYADPPAVGSGMRRQVHFMAKEELFKTPVLGFLVRKVGSFPVRRGTADRKALKRAVELLGDGKVVCLFPEGTRSLDGRLQDPELGIGLVALKSGAPVVPVAVIGTNKLLPAHSIIPRFHRVKVVYGPKLWFGDLCQAAHDRAALEEVGRRSMQAIAGLLATQRENGSA